MYLYTCTCIFVCYYWYGLLVTTSNMYISLVGTCLRKNREPENKNNRDNTHNDLIHGEQVILTLRRPFPLPSPYTGTCTKMSKWRQGPWLPFLVRFKALPSKDPQKDCVVFPVIFVMFSDMPLPKNTCCPLAWSFDFRFFRERAFFSFVDSFIFNFSIYFVTASPLYFFAFLPWVY